VKRQLRRIRDRALRKIGLIRISALPMRDFTISHHHPIAWTYAQRQRAGGPPYALPEIFELKQKAKNATVGNITIEGTLRGGQRVTGELREVIS
jgi:hypothetical protein